jgi:hypothetical protein
VRVTGEARKRLNGAIVGVAAGVAAIGGLTAASYANDATAVMGAGGLELVSNSAIAIMAEDLYVSADEIRVAYRFRNVTKAPVTVTVAFPLPPLGGEDFIDMNIAIPNPESANYVDFRLWVDGQELTPMVEHRATALGIDRTDTLIAAGLPLNPFALETGEMIGAMRAPALDDLARAGLIIREEWGTLPVWQLQTTFYWEQTFPVGRDIVIEHSYRPIVGYSFLYAGDLDIPEVTEPHCVDDAFRTAVGRLLTPTQGDPYPALNARRIQYILTTANSWAAPIGTFTLTVDKGSPNAFVSFCAEGVTRTSPTTFVVTETDFYAERELDVLIVEPIAP